MPKKTDKIVEIRALNGGVGGIGWQVITQAQMKRLPPGTTIAISRDTPAGRSTLYTIWRSPRRRDESPVQFYKRTKCCPDNYHHVHKGRYYCNPAHCSRSWASKTERDKHLVGAYAILD